ncbi:MAG: Na+/H+ antiporter subunit E [Acholeplasmataceae bacterium]
MKFFRQRLIFFLIILTFWFLLNLNFRIETILFGILVSLIVSIASNSVLFDEHGFRYHGIRLVRLPYYLLVLFFEIFKSSFVYIGNILSQKYEPIIVTIELELLDPVQVGIVANSITLTPGTISVEIDGTKIYVFTLAEPKTDPKTIEKAIRDKFERLLKTEGRHDDARLVP